MEEIKNMLSAFISSQTAFNQKVLKRFDDLEKELKDRIDSVESRLSKRLDKIGRQLSYLEDDTPTRAEFDDLKRRVDKVEHSNL